MHWTCQTSCSRTGLKRLETRRAGKSTDHSSVIVLVSPRRGWLRLVSSFVAKGLENYAELKRKFPDSECAQFFAG
jgi:hypothetical protein